MQASEEIKCCICETSGHESSYRDLNGGWRLVRCSVCGLVYLKNPPAAQADFIEAALNKLNNAPGSNEDDLEYWSVPALYEKRRKVFDGFFEQRIKAIDRLRDGALPRNVLDIGCGYGFFMNYCKELGIITRGFDVSRQAVTWAAERLGLNATVSDVNVCRPDETFDTVIMCDVLEHLPDPVGTLSQIKSWGDSNTLFYIQVPNILGWKYPSNAGFHVPHHLWQFSARTLRALLEKSGYEIAGWHFGVMGVIGAYERNQAGALHRAAWNVASKVNFGNRMAAMVRLKS